MSQEAQTSRRELLKRGTVLGAGLVVLGPALTACESMSKEKPRVITTGLINIGPAERYHAGSVSTAFMAQYGITISNDSGTVLAILPKCTHKGCTAPWDEEHNEFVCPCHGSKFDNLGQVVEGPAKKQLPGVAATHNADGTLSVDLDKLYATV